MLISSFGHSVDAKGRVFIPAKWRDDLGDTVIITRDMMGNADSRCLYGMPVELWNDTGALQKGRRVRCEGAERYAKAVRQCMRM